MPVYNVLLNSNNRVSGTGTSTCTYYFDWSILPDTPYRVSWGFVTGGNVDSTVNKVLLIEANLSQSSVFVANTIRVRATNSYFLGTAITNESGLSFLYGDRNTNGDIYLTHRPVSNEFEVNLKTLSGLPWTDSVGAEISDYILSLTFETIDK